MDPSDPQLRRAVESALALIHTTTTACAARVADHLGLAASGAQRILERDLLLDGQGVLRRKMPAFLQAFREALGERIKRELSPRAGGRPTLDTTTWQSLSLVEDHEVEERMFADRIGQQISHACEWELRDLAAYMGSLLGIGRADQDRNPLRPEVVGAALYHAIETVCQEPPLRQLLVREFGQALAQDMRGCYARILEWLRERGVQPVTLTVRTVDGPGNLLQSDSGYSTLPHDDLGLSHTQPGTFGFSGSGTDGSSGGGTSGGLGALPSRRDAYARSSVGAGDSGPSTWRRSGVGARATAVEPGARGGSRQAAVDTASREADAQLMALLRRLNALAGPAPDGTPGVAGQADEPGADGLVAVNLIRAHRDELRLASGGRLDHMVIDVVGSLFDQILSDSRVPPQMARQIARLQLPVLRVALNDASFFSSRRHPVRRFVNRIASLACAFDAFDDGPGREFLDRVSALVQEIVDGDFDQVAVYGAKLATLESFIGQQTQAEMQRSGAPARVLADKESEMRLQQRYMQQLQAALEPLALQDYLQEFLAQVWSQALMQASRNDGVQSEHAQRLRRAGRELVMSVQPKGSPAARQKFLMQLPGLMKQLNEGLQLIGWPPAAQKAFFGKLLPAHAESLKGPPLSELDYNLMARQLDAIFDAPLPASDDLARTEPMPPRVDVEIEQHFSAEEAAQVGLVPESAIDWSAPLDIDLTAAEDEAEDSGSGAETAPLDLGVSLDPPGEPEEPTAGPQLADHIRLGFAYQMHLKDSWQKVRLSYVSPGRAFFVFTHGGRHQETISMTARMVRRMCDSGRLRAFERRYLMERATARARRQLAALRAEAQA